MAFVIGAERHLQEVLSSVTAELARVTQLPAVAVKDAGSLIGPGSSAPGHRRCGHQPAASVTASTAFQAAGQDGAETATMAPVARMTAAATRPQMIAATTAL